MANMTYNVMCIRSFFVHKAGPRTVGIGRSLVLIPADVALGRRSRPSSATAVPSTARDMATALDLSFSRLQFLLISSPPTSPAPRSTTNVSKSSSFEKALSSPMSSSSLPFRTALICRRLLIVLSCRCRAEESRGTAPAVPDTNDSARGIWVGIGRNGPAGTGALA